MSKKLITVRNIQDYIFENRITVTEDMIITPGAKDRLKELGVEIVYGKKFCDLKDNDKEFEKKVIGILVKEFSITDSSIIQKIIAKLKEIK